VTCRHAFQRVRAHRETTLPEREIENSAGFSILKNKKTALRRLFAFWERYPLRQIDNAFERGGLAHVAESRQQNE
jgi:hypothetical protein